MLVGDESWRSTTHLKFAFTLHIIFIPSMFPSFIFLASLLSVHSFDAGNPVPNPARQVHVGVKTTTRTYQRLWSRRWRRESRWWLQTHQHIVYISTWYYMYIYICIYIYKWSESICIYRGLVNTSNYIIMSSWWLLDTPSLLGFWIWPGFGSQSCRGQCFIARDQWSYHQVPCIRFA